MKNKKTLIFVYHNIVNSSDNLYLYDVSLQMFKQQTEYICVMHKTISGTGIILTFDDGYKSWANEVLDSLKRFDLKAYFFICIKYLKEGKITKQDILKLKENGMTIGSHSLTHRFLNTLSEPEIFYELSKSKEILEDIIQEEVKYFSIPRGIHTPAVIEIAKRAGYQNVFTSEIGINNNPSFLLKRIPIRRNTTLSDFKNILNGKKIKQMVFNQKFKDSAKALLGIDNYTNLRRILVPRAE